ncbi:MAG: CHAD domain-containing protein [Planctomycetia bacterium]|nr:CHAD domain-containing protein [Planctomycetia bacterium]
MNTTDSKRLAELQENTPLADAARRVLSIRLEAVRDCLGQALNATKDRRKSVHALRVASRRAVAALDVFADCLPRRVFKEARNAMRTLRRAVGTARDWDVLLQQLARKLGAAADSDRAPLDMLRGYALAHRLPAQSRLEAACPDHPFGFDRLMARCVAAVRVRNTEPVSFGGHLRPIVARLVANLDTRAAEGDGDWDRLHDVRIAGKRLRYTLELVPEAFGGPMQTHLGPALARLQEVLGEVNDSFNASRLLRQLVSGMTDCAPEAAVAYGEVLEAQAAAHEAVMQRGREAYREWLRDWDAPEMQDALRAICPDARGRGHGRAGLTASRPADPTLILGRTA